ncbi:heparan-alpha-glucosaminide N-acetyltransferase domain-containing protein [Glutamicibacter ardleyensis]|uniref:heparan-alpha-glucosaminide N-acetyltransferase domain-containing protein n=1 Tax=Glutamicibacter ardleyensis TaxID=225894 RepID=UPI003FD5A80F
MSQDLQRRITGIDAARGIALMGMLAIHVMPQFNDDFEPTLVWQVASGTSAALFALLAGVGLSLGSKSATQSAAQLAGARASLAARAGFILGLGLVLGLIDIPAFVILSYYAVMFALAIPLLRLKATSLAFASLGFATVGSIFTWLISPSLPGLDGIDPSLSTLFAEPGATLSSLLFTGAYPAVPWMSFVCAGMALGKLDLRSRDLQLRMGLTGLVLWLGSWALSALLLGPLGGKAALIYSTARVLDSEELNEALVFGLPDEVPLDSLWWLVTLSPHSDLVFELLNTLGVALLVLSIALLIGQRVPWLLRPLAIVGSMTLSIYTLHLLFLATGVGVEHPMASFWLQILGSLLLAVLWRNISGLAQGPLEHVTSALAGKAKGRALVRKG